MAERKYISEFGLNMIVDYKMLLQQDHLSEVGRIGFSPHIYMVGRRPRITLCPDSVQFTKDRVTGEFKKQVQEKQVSIPFDVPNYLGTDEVTVECSYPYTEFRMLDRSGCEISSGKSANLLREFGGDYLQHLDLEILYIGQSYGKKGERSAPDRLTNHETLQGIYAEAMNSTLDQDIWLLLLTFQMPMTFVSFDGRLKNAVLSPDDDLQRMHQVLGNEISERQRINFTEAALIKYFEPVYNTTFKHNFPNPAHKTYSECYDLDLNMVSVEMPMEELGVRLWSKLVRPSFYHFCSFPLHSAEERRSMFDFFT